MRLPTINKLSFMLALPGLLAGLQAETRLPAIFGDHMVLQRNQPVPVWGWDEPGTRVTVKFGGQSHTVRAESPGGRWAVRLDPLAASAGPRTLSVVGTSSVEIKDVVVGEVWLCSGQSNMAWPLSAARNGDLEMLSAGLPLLRLISVPQVGTQEPQADFAGSWSVATPESSRSFSALGFFFGRYLQQILGVPVGLIDNAWGGSAAEAWIRRTELEQDERFAALLERSRQQEAQAASPAVRAEYLAQRAEWETAVASATREGKPPPREPRDPAAWLKGNHRPGNIFNGVLLPTVGYGIKGVIWYQGESNRERPAEYRELFPFLIEQWRKEWAQGDFPFYWVQLADFEPPPAERGHGLLAELREAQTLALRLPRTGQAVITDLGEGHDIHPRDKHTVATRLVRWALANDYGLELSFRSPEFQRLETAAGRTLVTFNCFGSTLRWFDTPEVAGFELRGDDGVWHPAEARLQGANQVELASDEVAAPVAVRYAWADNPAGNLYSREGLPVTPFRSDGPVTSGAPPVARPIAVQP